MEATTKTFNLIPDYKRIFQGMLRDAKMQGRARDMFSGHAWADPAETRAELLRELQRWFAPLTIATNCATTVDAINELREVMTDMLGAIDQEAARLERGADDDPTNGEGLI